MKTLVIAAYNSDRIVVKTQYRLVKKWYKLGKKLWEIREQLDQNRFPTSTTKDREVTRLLHEEITWTTQNAKKNIKRKAQAHYILGEALGGLEQTPYLQGFQEKIKSLKIDDLIQVAAHLRRMMEEEQAHDL